MTNHLHSVGKHLYLDIEKSTSIAQLQGIWFKRTIARKENNLLLEVARG